MKRIFFIDGNSLAHRAYYAMPYFTNERGEPTGAVYGFANLLIKLIVEEKPDGLVVAFDHARKTFRNEIYDKYKANRKATPDDLRAQLPLVKSMLGAMGITTIEQSGIEGDDIIGTLSTKFPDYKKIVISGDRDLLQLVDLDTEVWLTKKGLTDLQKVDVNTILVDFGIHPYQVVELKALMGDTSDNIPGVAGVGEKTALKLIKEYESINNLYNNLDKISGALKQKLIDGKVMAEISKTLATIKRDCSIKLESTDYQFPFSEKTKEFFKQMTFSSLLKRQGLFVGEELVEKSILAKKVKISGMEDLDALISNTKDKFAYDLERMEFSNSQDEVFYINPVYDLFSDSITADDVLNKLKEIFEKNNILKITYSAKKDIKKLREYGIKLNNYFDMEIAKYLLYAGKKINDNLPQANSYFSLMEEYLDKIDKMGLKKLLYECELPLIDVLENMENNGFKIDKNILNAIDEDFTEKIINLKNKIIELAGEEFNIDSPKQTSYILFDKLMLKSFNNKKKSTSADYLEEMIDQHEIVELILNYRKLSKIKNTYIDVYKKICATKGEVIHTVFNQTLTSTGRLSSSDPNLQNIPTRDDLGKNLRKVFVSKFEGGSLISADYNQIELRLLAAMSKEPALIDAYKNGEDIHSLTASQIFGVDIKDVTPNQRREAKAVNFGVIYGISDYGLSQNIKISRKRAKEYIDSYFERYPLVRKFSDENIEFARKNGYVRTLFGRIRQIPEINSGNYNLRSFAERVAMNMPLQGTASDIIKFAMIRVFEKLKSLKSQLILQIHDELIIDVYPGEEEIVRKILKETMENIVDLSVKLIISIGEGKNLYDCK